MHYSSGDARPSIFDRAFQLLCTPGAVALAILAITVARLWLLTADAAPPVTPGEAEVWLMGHDPRPAWPDSGPLLPWLVRLVSTWCGTEAECLRLLAPVAQGMATWCLYHIGAALFDRRTGFWCMVVHATLPIVFWDSLFIGPVAVLASPWALALLALGRTMTVDQRLTDWVGLGVGIGVGVLIHPLMLLFVPLALVFLLLSGTAARLPWRPGPYVAVLTVLACAWPDIMWNAAHDWQGYRASLVALDDAMARLPETLDSLATDLGALLLLLGPVMVAMVALLTVRLPLEIMRGALRDFRARLLMLFSVPVLLVALALGGLAEGSATLFGPAVPATVVLVTAWLVVRDRVGWVRLIAITNVLLIGLVLRGPEVATRAGWVVPAGFGTMAEGVGWASAGPWLEGLAEAYEGQGLGVAGDDAAILAYQAARHGLEMRVIGTGLDTADAFNGILVMPAALAEAGGDIRGRLTITRPDGRRREWAAVRVEE